MEATERRRRLLRRGMPLLAIALFAFVAGAIVGAGSGGDGRDSARRFTAAWTRQDFGAMRAQLSEEAQARHSPEAFRRAYLESYAAATTITVRALSSPAGGRVAGREVMRVPIEVRTRSFGKVSEMLELPMSGGKVAWEPNLVFPGLRTGERLGRRVEIPRRASILARDGTPLARSNADGKRASPLGEAAEEVAGTVGVLDDEQRRLEKQRRGFPADAKAGISGLELAYDDRLAGTPGGELLAVRGDSPEDLEAGRRLARSKPVPARALRTTIDPGIQSATVAALGGRFGGAAVLDAMSGEVRALAGIAYSGPQPPGSTFKMVTAAAALEAAAAKPETRYPVETSATIGGREIENAHDDACGGTLVDSFALSCNSVFAPLGVEVGSKRLIEMAEALGFNRAPRIFDERATRRVQPRPSTIPRSFDSRLELSVTAIGQGRVLTTPLQMASIAQAIAADGILRPTPIARERELRPKGGGRRAMSRRTARVMRRMMRAVVTTGTGRRAAVAGVEVAGKTGTAELGPKPRQGELQTGDLEQLEEEQELDAWFAAFAPLDRPRLALAIMFVKADAEGGELAAPAASQIIAAALGG